jgi:hypothetical protein
MLELPGSVTMADLNDESKMSSVHKAALVTWKTLHKLSEVIEPWLDGTPFKIPLSIFNMISTAAEVCVGRFLHCSYIETLIFRLPWITKRM